MAKGAHKLLIVVQSPTKTDSVRDIQCILNLNFSQSNLAHPKLSFKKWLKNL